MHAVRVPCVAGAVLAVRAMVHGVTHGNARMACWMKVSCAEILPHDCTLWFLPGRDVWNALLLSHAFNTPAHAHLPPSPSHAPPFPPRCRSQGAGNVAKDIKYADIEPLFPWKPKWVPVVR